MKWPRSAEQQKLQADLQRSTPSECPHLPQQTLQRSSGSSREPGGETGGGRGGGGSTMPQCSPSARPQNKAQWLHCQQTFSCTLLGLPDTRPLLFFNNSTTTFSGAGATVCSSAAGLKETILRSTAAVSDCFCIFFHSDAPTDVLQENGRLSPRRRELGRGRFLVPELLKTAGVENTVVHSARQSAEFSRVGINGRSGFSFRKRTESEGTLGMNHSQQRCPSMIHRTTAMDFKNLNAGASILKNQRGRR